MYCSGSDIRGVFIIPCHACIYHTELRGEKKDCERCRQEAVFLDSVSPALMARSHSSITLSVDPVIKINAAGHSARF